MLYYESDILDKSSHNSWIEKVYYFEKIDKVILIEQNMRLIKIYDAKKMKQEPSI